MTDVTARLSTALADRYRIVSRLGEGGMATVYLAEDVKHDRKVALKVLKAELAAVLGAERFVQEIKTTASLQHPHILPLFDSGEADGFLYYVMPYIDGETLRAKLDREHQLGIEEAVRITTEVADALHYAHQQGVIHRDIKPENILIQNGRPMVADFGIALAVSAAAGGRMTETGLSLGTPHYMSPEQATAEKELSARSDVYSLASVLYEMLSGEPPHLGGTAQQIIMKIVADTPRPVTELRKSVPPHVAAAVTKALEKLAADRFETAEAFAGALHDEAFVGSSVGTGYAAVHRAGDDAVARFRRMAIAAVAVATVATAVAILGWLRPVSSSPPPMRVSLALPDAEALLSTWGSVSRLGAQFALSHDGRRFVYAGPSDAGRSQLWVRELDALHATPLPETEDAFFPAFAPDGNAVAFMTAAGELRVASLLGAPTVTVIDSGVWFEGGLDWGDDGYLYAAGAIDRAIAAVPWPDDGVEFLPGVLRIEYPSGRLSVATLVDSATTQVFPRVLPGSHGMLFALQPQDGNLRGYRIAVADLSTREVRALDVEGVLAQYVDGHLVVTQGDGRVMVAPFDARRLELRGAMRPIQTGVRVSDAGTSEFSLSRSGVALYRVGARAERRLVWVDRRGQVQEVDPSWREDFETVALGPGDRGLAVSINTESGGQDIWIRDFSGGPTTKITYGGTNFRPRWHPDGRRLLYNSNAGTNEDIYVASVDGSSDAVVLIDEDDRVEEALWSPDGAWVVYRTEPRSGNRDIFARRLGADSTRRALVVSPHNTLTPTLSANQQWLAYVSDETGIEEVFVRPFPDATGYKLQVSLEGGRAPLWSRRGNELFYRDLQGALIAVEVRAGERPSFGERRMLHDGESLYTHIGNRAYDVTEDGQRFIAIQTLDAGDVDLILATTWLRDALRDSPE